MTVLTLVCAAVLGAAVLLVAASHFRPFLPKPMPARCRVENNTLKVYAKDDRLLWQHLFAEEIRKNPPPQFEPYCEAVDLDGDGVPEVLFQAAFNTRGAERFFCFDSNGSLRFQDPPVKSIRFGDVTYDPPFAPRSFRTIAEPDGTRSVWLMRIHWEMFPSLAQRLDPHGKVLAEYWNNGHISSVSDAWIGGTRLALIGGLSNEKDLAASLVALPYEHASGSTPATGERWRCANCPAGSPLAYVIFPRMEVSRVAGGSARVSAAMQVSDGTLHVEVQQGEWRALSRGGTEMPVFYDLDAQFHPIRGEFGSDHKANLRRLMEEKIFKQPLNKSPDDELFPLLLWKEDRFIELAPTGWRTR